ncbi:MAG: glycosyltransferase [Acidobacteriota bacterium]
MDTQPEARLRRNAEVYDSLIALLQGLRRQVDGESTLLTVEAIAQFAANYHVGRFADGALENPAFDVGASLNSTAGRSTPAGPTGNSVRRSTVLHVATGATLFGGVGRTILNWILADDQHRHLLALTKDHNLSTTLEQAVASSGGAVTRLRGRLLERAATLRGLAEHADLVFLHHGRADALPIAAFAAGGLPPVGLVNQADHTFWLGKSVADVIVHQRVVGLPLSIERRASQHNVSLPIPLRDPFESVSVGTSRDRARQALGIPSSQLMLASVGRAIKFIPNASHNFFSTMTKLLERHRDAHVYLVGPTLEEILPSELRAVHPRIHFVGYQPDPSIYIAACDVYLESYPFGSQTSCLEACLGARPPILAYAPESPLFVFHDESVAGLLSTAATEAEYLDQASVVIGDRQGRLSLGEQVRERVLAAHVGPGWLTQLDTMYQTMSRRGHVPAPIAVEPGGTTSYDVDLATFLEAQAWRPLASSSHRIRLGILSDLATSLYTDSNRRDMMALLRGIWSQSRGPQDVAVAAVVTGAALARAGRRAYAATPANVLREA